MQNRHRLIPKGRFYIKDKKNLELDQSIYIRFFINGRYATKCTGIKTKAAYWNDLKQRIIGQTEDVKRKNLFLENYLNQIQSVILNYDGELNYKKMTNILNRKTVEEKSKVEIPISEFIEENNKRLYETNNIVYSTYRDYQIWSKLFTDYLNFIGKPELELKDMTIELLDDYFMYRKQLRKIKGSTIILSMSPIKKALKRAVEMKILDYSSIVGMLNYATLDKKTRQRRIEKQKIKYLSKEEIQRMIILREHLSDQSLVLTIDVFLFSFYACGLRISDIATLTWNEIDFNKKLLIKNQLKTQVPVVIPLNEKAIEILMKYKNDKKLVFGLMTDEQLMADDKTFYEAKTVAVGYIDNRLKRLSRNYKLMPGLSIHCARHTFAVFAINSGMNIKFLSKLMGHSSVWITEKTYAEVLNQTLKDSYHELFNSEFFRDL